MIFAMNKLREILEQILKYVINSYATEKQTSREMLIKNIFEKPCLLFSSGNTVSSNLSND